jgi:hypothetical protein
LETRETYTCIESILEEELREMNHFEDLGSDGRLILKYTYLLTYLLHGAFLHEKLVKKFPSFYGTRKFITLFTSARHLSLS